MHGVVVVTLPEPHVAEMQDGSHHAPNALLLILGDAHDGHGMLGAPPLLHIAAVHVEALAAVEVVEGGGALQGRAGGEVVLG